MKVKRALLVVEGGGTAFDRVFQEIKKPTGRYAGMSILSFPDFDTLGKIVNPSRLEILAFVRKNKPKSIQALAKQLKRDFKNVYTDVQALVEYGLIELKAKGRGKASSPTALFEELVLAS